MVENRAPGSSELLKALFPSTGHARIIGLTGAPGAGKSTLVDQLARFYRRGADNENRTVGIVAVDPTSPYTGGAILGDRIRMQEHFSDPGIYIRSMATRGSLGSAKNRSTGPFPPSREAVQPAPASCETHMRPSAAPA